MANEDIKRFTAEGIKKLQEELNYLISVRRNEVAEQIKEAKSFGDLSENAEYDAARNEQSRLEGRIQELEYILSNAEVISEEELGQDVVNVGTTVTVFNETRGKQQTYSIVGANDANPFKGHITLDSPVGKALEKHTTGDVVQVTVPNGVHMLRIEKIERT